jgi:hypothetical protein
MSATMERPNTTHRKAAEPSELFPQWTQPCPNCDGTITAADINIGRWRPMLAITGALHVRTVSMACPHCKYAEARTESKPA